MKEKWTEKMRRKMEGHQMAPPEGLWEDIGKQMGFPSEPVGKPTAFGRWRLVAAAAAVLALVGFFTLYHHDGDKALSQAESGPSSNESISRENTLKNPISEPINLMAEEVPATDTPVGTSTAASSVSSDITPSIPAVPVVPTTPINPTASITPTTPSVEESPVTLASDTNEPQKEIAEQSPSKEEIRLDEGKDRLPSLDIPLSEDVSVKHSRQTTSGKWSLGLNASGGLLAAESTSRTAQTNINYMSSNAYNMESFDKGYRLGNYPEMEEEMEHYLPLRIGLTMQFQLSQRLALVSGLNYTYLFSKTSKPLHGVTVDEQRLHYLGVPVGLAFQMWSTKRFNLYLSGRTMVEKCLNEKPWQWSVQAAAGVEYQITPLVGAYFEPALGYYFDDGTSFKHYYKEHPWAPSLELGVRLHLGKDGR